MRGNWITNMCVIFGLGSYCFWYLLPSIFGYSTFTEVATVGGEQILAVYENLGSKIQCALLCDDGHNEKCTGFQFRSDSNVCRLYEGSVVVAVNFTSNNFLHKKYNCTEDGFELIELAGLRFCYKFVVEKMNYFKATKHCNTMNSYLIKFDDLREYDAFRPFVSNHSGLEPPSVWTGANDVLSEGVWVTTKDNGTIDPSLWLWAPREPNNLHNEHCAEMNDPWYALNDRHCFHMSYFVCEKPTD